MNLSRRRLLKHGAAALAAGMTSPLWATAPAEAKRREKASVHFEPTWASLAQYQTPEWFRDAKFGIWATWGPQCVPEQGDWYARGMYQEGSAQYKYHCKHYGPPSTFGFKDLTNIWKAEAWDPEHLIGLYKAAGAKYFMCMANHHDDFDNFDSTYQPWNSTKIGPKKDIVGGWEKVVRAAGLRFAVSVHAAHAWTFYEAAQGADKLGPLAGVPYDGKMTAAAGAGLWWNGLDPQDLYAQNHTPSAESNVHKIWDWPTDGSCSMPSAAYCEKFYNRTIELIDKYNPDQIYFDDTVLPFYPINDVGVRIAAYFYNANMQYNKGALNAVINGKILSDQQKLCLVSDLERGISDTIQTQPYQTDTCIGNWHYDINLYEHHRYKKADQVAHMLVDTVSKNGNLMLNIPLPGSGQPDPDELKFLADFTQWMAVNNSGIYGTRPWLISGEGPSDSEPAIKAQGFNESNRTYTSQDFRFMQKGGSLYAFALAWPDNGILTIQSLATGSGKIDGVQVLGCPGQAPWTQTPQGLVVTLPATPPCSYVYGLQINGKNLIPVPAASKTLS